MRAKLWLRDLLSIWWWLLPRRRNGGVRILVYHAVTTIPPRQDRWRLSVPPERFAAHLQWLKQWGYVVVTLDEALDMVSGRRPIPSKAVALTFDDGFRDLWTRAYPLLRQAGLPAAVFVVPGHLNDEEPFPWLEHAEGFERPLSWEELRQLGGDPRIVVGSHTWSHRRLSELSSEEQEQEITRSKAALESALGRPVRWFAYPYGHHGSFSEETIDVLARSGFAAACTNIMGVNERGASPWRLKRTRVGWEDGRLRFRLKLAGAYDWVDTVRER